ncbi:protein REVEILLE 6 [Oryza sativa Japonica Group]|uniref:MYB29 protein n=2 Tax=Oryza sativa subsp. japonica TaxID=39947 RepID=Q0DFA0_ORYSJ|nr:protein REVEILLE 6 [Oryza sativa Japonica Group]BAD67706.1 putative MYB29 protein [Oryza sativa Japonica Group]BAF18473.1 Os06g0105800 [Oryza sativa Japonica Group]BAG99362.1 unnamed protein product [Oryza sativa Japonica Group]BAG99725.1 unnamed protein product [Oryza sativa Japonica Group]BAS95745.1 Os06g0105800 [Oryza sativa Japonica Group]|eukprot:NP_001056559.1 Os06g0105800 [Oryza sativa Japonica Group]
MSSAPQQLLDSSSPGPGPGPEVEDDGGRRVRKPYTITKSRESWTDPEHDKFLEALQLFDRDWKKIEAYVGSKTVIQIRSHAQKYFLKVQKNGTGEHLPPPRPKRKAAHPYPHKASKRAPQVVLPQQASHLMEQGCLIPMDISPVARNFNANDVFSSWDSALAQSFSPRHTHGAANNCSSSVESQSGTCPTSEAIEQEIMLPTLRAMPDFAQVYNFLGSIFDPETSGHLQRLREMDPIDVETVLLLMKNLSINLTNPNFEAHRKVLASHGYGMDQVKHENLGDLGSTHTLHLPFMVTTK